MTIWVEPWKSKHDLEEQKKNSDMAFLLIRKTKTPISLQWWCIMQLWRFDTQMQSCSPNMKSVQKEQYLQPHYKYLKSAK